MIDPTGMGRFETRHLPLNFLAFRGKPSYGIGGIGAGVDKSSELGGKISGGSNRGRVSRVKTCGGEESAG